MPPQFLQHRGREAVGDIEVVDRDHRDRALGFGVADDVGDPRLGDHQADRKARFDFDEIAFAGVAEIAPVDTHLLLLAIDRDEAGAVIVDAHDADLAAPRLVEDLHRTSSVVRDVAFTGVDAGEDAVAGRGRDAERSWADGP